MSAAAFSSQTRGSSLPPSLTKPKVSWIAIQTVSQTELELEPEGGGSGWFRRRDLHWDRTGQRARVFKEEGKEEKESKKAKKKNCWPLQNNRDKFKIRSSCTNQEIMIYWPSYWTFGVPIVYESNRMNSKRKRKQWAKIKLKLKFKVWFIYSHT